MSRLIADVGGTNTRIALVEQGSTTINQPQCYINREHSSLECILEDWLHRRDVQAKHCVLAVAAPPSDDRVTMTNMDWSFSCSALASRFGFEQLLRLNDFEASAYALPYLVQNDLVSIKDGTPNSGARMAIVGPGTGLGGAVLHTQGDEVRSLSCEPGQMGLSASSDLELELLRWLLAKEGSSHAELLVSGPGLSRLYLALADIRGETAVALAPAEITRLAQTGENTLAEETLSVFCALLGSICGDFLLATGSYDGLFLSGGIIPGLWPFLKNSEFNQRFIAKGAMQETLNQTPVNVITHPYPGLIGAAKAPL
ncbi:MAG: glucokinase [Pseudomonadota bacterium]